MENKKTLRIKDVLPLKSFMKVVIDGPVETDTDGNFLINIGYIRVSTETQVEYGFGLDVQEDKVVEYCKNHHVQSLVLFTDDGITGTTMDRRALDEIVAMIDAFNSNKSKLRVNFLIVPRLDRLSRTLLGTLQFIQDYIAAASEAKNTKINRNKEAINFVSVAEEACTLKRQDPQSQLMLVMFAAFAEFERSQIVQKMRDGKAERIKKGKWPGGGNLPYGYRYDKESGKLVLIPEKVDTIREVFRLYIEEKMSPQKIATLLGFDHERTVSQLLRRESLTGRFVYRIKDANGKITEKTSDSIVEPVISRERWEEAQEEIRKRSVFRGDSHYLLSGLVCCGECGAKMRYQKWDKKTGECKLVCYSRQKSKPYLVENPNCDNGLFWASDIEDAVINSLFSMKYLGNDDVVKEAPRVDPKVALEKELKAVRSDLKYYHKEMSVAKERYGEEYENVVVREEIDKLVQKELQILKQLKTAECQNQIERKIQRAKNSFKKLNASWEMMSQEERQAICRELIDRVKIYKNGTVDLELTIQSFIVKNDTESIK